MQTHSPSGKLAESSEALGLNALGWLVANDELLPVFLGSTGASIDDVRSQAGEPAFLASVLDFILMDDAWVIACGDAISAPYEDFAVARSQLAGPSEMHWT